jgi:hypothetical protein
LVNASSPPTRYAAGQDGAISGVVPLRPILQKMALILATARSKIPPHH